VVIDVDLPRSDALGHKPLAGDICNDCAVLKARRSVGGVAQGRHSMLPRRLVVNQRPKTVAAGRNACHNDGMGMYQSASEVCEGKGSSGCQATSGNDREMK
jgi:hypothetical protein